MSDRDPSTPGLHVPIDSRADPLSLSRQLFSIPYENIPTQADLDKWFEHWSTLAVPAFSQLPSVPPPMREWLGAYEHGARDALKFWPKLGTTQAISHEALKAWMDKVGITEWLSSLEAADKMWLVGDPKGEPMEITRFNGGLYTHENGKLNRINSDDIVKLFPEGRENEWPTQIILTANHARCRGSDHVVEIMSHIEALCKKALKKKFVLEPRPDAPKDNTVAGKTIILAAVHAQETSPREGADLLYRNHFLRHHDSLHERIRANSEPGIRLRAPEERISDRELDLRVARFDHRAPSPAGIRLAKLLLKTMAEDPQALDEINDCFDAQGRRKGFLDDTRTLVDMEGDGIAIPRPLVLRADALQVMNRFTAIGYSKSVTTTNDMRRYVQHELSSHGQDETPIFAQRMADGSLRSMDEATISTIMGKLGLIGINGPTHKLTNEEIRLGALRLRLLNEFDAVGGHFDDTDHSTENLHPRDVVYTYQGQRRELGHDSEDSLGFGNAAGDIARDPNALKLLRLVLQPKYGGKAADPEAGRPTGNWTDYVHPANATVGTTER